VKITEGDIQLNSRDVEGCLGKKSKPKQRAEILK